MVKIIATLNYMIGSAIGNTFNMIRAGINSGLIWAILIAVLAAVIVPFDPVIGFIGGGVIGLLVVGVLSSSASYARS